MSTKTVILSTCLTGHPVQLPLQKSQLVRMVKEAKAGNVTAAIGDGGNDISMIQEAHVGLGIIGLEGNAAAKAADFAFSKVHGCPICSRTCVELSLI